MHITNELLASIFADSAAYCGKEDVLHAMIHHRLKKAGFPHERIAREQALNNGRVDIVVYGDGVSGDFSSTQKKPLASMEVKGGAYGNRNALKDEIDASGYCNDMAKLKPEATRGIESWFLCVHMPELGRAISPLKAELVSEQCAAHGLAFAYYCQGEGKFLVSRPRQKLTTYPVTKATAACCKSSVDFLFNRNDSKLAKFARDCLAVNGHEANITARLYDCLRESGFGVAQLSLETYFSFAKQPGSRMQERPDLVVFDAGFDGRFNLYKGGDSKRSNDPHKLAHISTIFEVKGGASMSKKGDKAVMQDYLADIQKLNRWREGAAKARSGTHVQTVFLGVDGRTSGLSTAAVETLVGESGKLGNGLIYINRNQLETVQPRLPAS